jgi:hypothetical protein
VADLVGGEQFAQRAVLGVGEGVVGHQPTGADGVAAAVEGQRAFEEGGDGAGALVVVQLDVGQARVVVDDRVHVVVADARFGLHPVPGGLGALAGRAMSGPPKRAARRALTYALGLLEGVVGDTSRVRTAALIGALREAVAGGMTPTTGDVARLVLDRQQPPRDAYRTLSAASAAAGLNTVDANDAKAMSLAELTSSAAGDVVRAAIEIRRRSGTAEVHLRHVLATGVHPAVPEPVFEELGVTRDELRAEWRNSIARTWPDELKAWTRS